MSIKTDRPPNDTSASPPASQHSQPITDTPSSRRAGLLYALAAFGIWGVVPLYFNALTAVPPDEILAHRIVWSVVFLIPLLTVSGRWSHVAHCFRIPALRWTLLATTILIAVNWYVYIYGVVTHQMLQTSLGYFINPLVNVLLGMIFFRERMRPLQWLAITLATVGVICITYLRGELPWIALSLAGCFGTYGLFRKKVPVDGLVGLSVEIFLLVPLAAVYLAYLTATYQLALGQYGPLTDILLFASGAVTAVPLMCFAQAARRLRLSTMGFLQFISPSLQFLFALMLGEPLRDGELQSFICIWIGLSVFCADAVWARRR